MKKLLLIVLCMLPVATAWAQKPKAKAKPPVVMSVADVLPNYGLDTAIVNDTAHVKNLLESQPQDYVALTNYCVSIRTKAQQAIQSLENDYPHRDSLIYIDSNTVLSDYVIFEYRLRRLADLMGRMSIRYSRLEQQRVEMEKEAARKRAEEEVRRQQEERDRQAANLLENIARHHSAIILACDGVGIKDKARLKSLKDLYYSYLMVYNKYDLSAAHASKETIDKLDQLNSFQNDLLERVLGENSLPSQIENFKNVLKLRCDKDNSDIYRSYTHVFKQTSVPVSFADISEYSDYIYKLQLIINVQNRYLQTIDLRATINDGTNNIVKLYDKKYREVVNSYKDVLRTINQKPSFLTNSESVNFIQNLEEFIAAQQRYIDDYSLLEDINARRDSIVNGNKFRDVVSAYRDIHSSLVPIPDFKNTQEAAQYESQLADVMRVQKCYQEVVTFRREIEILDDSLMAGRKVDRTLHNGYRLLRKQADLTPSFSTLERGQNFLSSLNNHLEMQRLCLLIMHKRSLITANDDKISDKSGAYRNIAKAYSRMKKVYDDFDEITNTEDLRRYSRQCDSVLEMQQAFIKLLLSEFAGNADGNLKRETDVEKIKAVVGLN